MSAMTVTNHANITTHGHMIYVIIIVMSCDKDMYERIEKIQTYYILSLRWLLFT